MSGFSVPQFCSLYQGLPNSSGYINIYQTQTTTPVGIYSNATLTTPLSNPLTLDANGCVSFYYSGSVNLRIDAYTQSGTLVESIDPVYPVGSTTATPMVIDQSTNLSITTSNNQNNIIATANITLTLPLSTTLTNSFYFDFNAQSGSITFAPTSPDKINNGSSGGNYFVVQGISGRMWTDANGNWGINFASLGGLLNIQVFSSTGLSAYIPTPGMAKCIIELQGAGGACGGTTGAAASAGVGGSGGGGNYLKLLATSANIGSSAIISTGIGGAAASSGNNNGGNGANTSIAIGSSSSGIWIAGGGLGGSSKIATSAASNGGVPGAGGTATLGSTGAILLMNIPGQSGSLGYWLNNPNIIIACAGGNSILGMGGPAQAVISGTSGIGYGSGAGGGTNESASNAGGTAGQSGVIIITEYYAT